MKNLTFLKEIMVHLTLILFLLFAVSCDDQRSADSRDVAEDQNVEKFDKDKKEDEAQFLVNAAEMNLQEIQLGQLAQQKGTSPQVKELGKMMEDAHAKSLNDLKSLADNKMVTIPTSPTNGAQDAYKDLNDKTGEDFDKAYVNKVVDGHDDAIDKYEDVFNNSKDTDIKSWASKSLTELRRHHNHSKEVQKQIGEM